MSYKPAVTAILNYNSLFGLAIVQPWNPYTVCVSMQARKEASLFLNKHEKSVNEGMWCGLYIVLVNDKLDKNAPMNPSPFLVLQPKNVNREWWRKHRDINTFFWSQTTKRKSRNVHCHAHYLQTTWSIPVTYKQVDINMSVVVRRC